MFESKDRILDQLRAGEDGRAEFKEVRFGNRGAIFPNIACVAGSTLDRRAWNNDAPDTAAGTWASRGFEEYGDEQSGEESSDLDKGVGTRGGERNLPDSASKMPEGLWNPLAYLSGRKRTGAGEGTEYLLAVLLGRDRHGKPQGSGGGQASLRQYPFDRSCDWLHSRLPPGKAERLGYSPEDSDIEREFADIVGTD